MLFHRLTTTQKYFQHLRSNELVNVNLVAGAFGGGGHIRAAGCEIEGDKDEIILKVTELIKEQLDGCSIGGGDCV